MQPASLSQNGRKGAFHHPNWWSESERKVCESELHGSNPRSGRDCTQQTLMSEGRIFLDPLFAKDDQWRTWNPESQSIRWLIMSNEFWITHNRINVCIFMHDQSCPCQITRGFLTTAVSVCWRLESISREWDGYFREDERGRERLPQDRSSQIQMRADLVALTDRR